MNILAYVSRQVSFSQYLYIFQVLHDPREDRIGERPQSEKPRSERDPGYHYRFVWAMADLPVLLLLCLSVNGGCIGSKVNTLAQYRLCLRLTLRQVFLILTLTFSDDDSRQFQDPYCSFAMPAVSVYGDYSNTVFEAVCSSHLGEAHMRQRTGIDYGQNR